MQFAMCMSMLVLLALLPQNIFAACNAPASVGVDVYATFCSHQQRNVNKHPNYGPDAEACGLPSSERDADTQALQLSLANGLFGGAAGQDRDCKTRCVINAMSTGKHDTSHFRWNKRKSCWSKIDEYFCLYARGKATVFDVETKEGLCPITKIPLADNAEPCLPRETASIDVAMIGMCPSGSNGINRGPTAAACDPYQTVDVLESLKNGLFGLMDSASTIRDCTRPCLWSADETRTYTWSENGQCWSEATTTFICPDSNAIERVAVRTLKESLCAATPQETADITFTGSELQTVPGEATPCIPVNTALTSHRMDLFCSHDAACATDYVCVSTTNVYRGPSAVGCDDSYTWEVQLALANGLFGGASAHARDCTTQCLYDLFSDNYHYEWREARECWSQTAGTTCDANKAEADYVVARKEQMCAIPHIERPSDEDEENECTQVRVDLDAPLMNVLCSHNQPCSDDQHCPSQNGVERGPAAVGCDAEDNHNVRLSLANGLFGGAGGSERNCDSFCLFDYITPFNVLYKWDPKDQCWQRKQGNTHMCDGYSNRDYAVKRQGSLCPPTAAPTQTPTFTMPPTHAPSISPTSSSPTVSPTQFPTTSTPTVAPSTSPTTSTPTVAPTISPTTSTPTQSPTTSTPTVSPSSSPTTSTPTTSPTSSNPTTSPTRDPTKPPTVSPSHSPTFSSPTASPTTAPSMSPSVSPTAAPTVFCYQFNYTHLSSIIEGFCPGVTCVGDSCMSAGMEFGPAARACKNSDQDRVSMSLANGLFGGADGEDRVCTNLCIWDVKNPTRRSYKWDSKNDCWNTKSTKKCGGAEKEEWEYTAARYDDFCTVKAPEQQIIYGVAYESLFASAVDVDDSQLRVVAQTKTKTNITDTNTDTDTEPKQDQPDASTSDSGSHLNEKTSVWIPIIGIALLALVVLALIAVVTMIFVFTRGRTQSQDGSTTVVNSNGFGSKC